MKRPIIRSAQDLLSLPTYLESIDPITQPLRRIVTHYQLDQEFPCGLKGCRQPHKDGFLVELEDGNLSNVGHVCGKEFGEDRFGDEKRRYAEQVLRPQAIAIITTVLEQLQSLRPELAELRVHAERLSLYKRGLRERFSRLYVELERRAHNGGNRVSEQIELTPAEFEQRKAIDSRASRYREEYRGTLPGLGILAENVHDVVITRLVAKADELREVDLSSMATNQLLEWQRWSTDFDEAFGNAKKLVAAGERLFTKESFQLMSLLVINHVEKAAVAKLAAADLINGRSATTGIQSGAAAGSNQPMLSKKQRDLQKKYDAIARNSRERNRWKG